MAVAAIESVQRADQEQLVLSGDWTLATLPQPIAGFERRLRDLVVSHPGWDLRMIARLDSAGAILLWRAWGRQWPESLAISPQHRALLERVEAIRADVEPERPSPWAWPMAALPWRPAVAGRRQPSAGDARPDWPDGSRPRLSVPASARHTVARVFGQPLQERCPGLAGDRPDRFSDRHRSFVSVGSATEDLRRRCLHRQSARHQHRSRTRAGAGRGAGRWTFGVGDDRPDRRHAGNRRDRCAGHDGRLAQPASGPAEGRWRWRWRCRCW